MFLFLPILCDGFYCRWNFSTLKMHSITSLTFYRRVIIYALSFFSLSEYLALKNNRIHFFSYKHMEFSRSCSDMLSENLEGSSNYAYAYLIFFIRKKFITKWGFNMNQRLDHDLIIWYAYFFAKVIPNMLIRNKKKITYIF